MTCPPSFQTLVATRFLCIQSDFVLQRSYFFNSHSSEDGGAVCVERWDSIYMKRCSFVECSSDIRGGGAFLYEYTSIANPATFHENCFLKCENRGYGNTGGALHVHGTIKFTLGVFVNSVSIIGAASFRGVNTDASKTNFTGSTSVSEGQHVFLSNAEFYSLSYSHFTQSTRTIKTGDGAVSVDGGEATFENCNFINNDCDTLLFTASPAVFDDCVFAGTPTVVSNPGVVSVRNSSSDRHFEDGLAENDYTMVTAPVSKELAIAPKCAQLSTLPCTQVTMQACSRVVLVVLLIT